MAKKKSKKRSSQSKAPKRVEHEYRGKLSLVIPLYNEVERLPLMEKALRRFEGVWEYSYEVLLVNDGSSDNTLALLEETYQQPLTSDVKAEYRIVNVKQNAGKGNALKMGVAAATGDHLLTLDADMACTPDTLLSWLSMLEGHTFDDHTILIGSREHPDSDVKSDGSRRRLLGNLFNGWVQSFTGNNSRDTQCGFKLYPQKIAKWLFSGMTSKGWAHDVELLHKARLYDIDIVEMPISWQEVGDSKVSVMSDGIKMAFATIGLVLNDFFQFFFVYPFREMKRGLSLNRTEELPIYRFLFALLSLVLLFAMPYLSSDYGITADEYVQKTYGDHVLSYFETDGVNGEALTYQNLYLYGGLFDYMTAWLHKHFFTSWDIYEMRHFFNALVGALLMIFTGLLAKTVSQRWQVGFWALVFVVLSPRIFGHSMNNPKDIPFAFSYIFTLYYLIKFIRQLPKPSMQNMIGIVLGTAMSINIRVGGILLLPYLFLFTAGAFVVERRLHLPGAREGAYWFIRLAAMSVLAYLGGSFFWPFAQEDPINGPRLALSEMSNFSTGIRMIWSGEHYWSDFLPSHYILKWFVIATPALILLGSLTSVVPIWKDKRNRWLFLMAVFAGVFPIAYAIFKGSALYDGMRHFLFVYPVLVVMAAYGIVYSVELVHKKALTLALPFILLLGLYSPIRWMLKSHPNQYMYFNEFFGGIKNAYNKYETDYWMNSTKEASQWIIDNIPAVKEGKPLKIGTHAHKPVRHYFEPYENVEAVYNRYHERVKNDWDYGLYISRFVNAGFIDNGLFPPGEEVIAKREIDGVLIWAVTRRSAVNKAAAAADEYMKPGTPNYNPAEAIRLLEVAVAEGPKDESALVLLAQYYLQSGNMPKAKEALDKLLEYSDRYSNSLGLMGMYYLRQQNVDSARYYLERATSTNIKYVFGHYNLANIYANEGRFQDALTHLELFDRYGGGRKPDSYNLPIQVASQLNNRAALTYFQAKQTSLTGNWQAALPLLAQSLAFNPDYAPAIKMQADYDKAVAFQQRMQERKEILEDPNASRTWIARVFRGFGFGGKGNKGATTRRRRR